VHEQSHLSAAPGLLFSLANTTNHPQPTASAPQNPGVDVTRGIWGSVSQGFRKVEPPSPSYKNKSSMICNKKAHIQSEM